MYHPPLMENSVASCQVTDFLCASVVTFTLHVTLVYLASATSRMYADFSSLKYCCVSSSGSRIHCCVTLKWPGKFGGSILHSNCKLLVPSGEFTVPPFNTSVPSKETDVAVIVTFELIRVKFVSHFLHRVKFNLHLPTQLGMVPDHWPLSISHVRCEEPTNLYFESQAKTA